ncbi:UTRA domain-containing protein [Neobacillus sp. C211]|jgi:GntR family transcriptional regulator, frlABCD operon transcriptional regulator|uniref:UTRA domain-containing protein n=1 Tax=Priestia megaterium TaxID=1404 RepID=A0A6H1NZN3_PRIMG|nr:UTRA domain-containing protein [Priestia megaterium]QIZ06759.1 UTRA domain-containing protein [Priestia megaterium]
MKLNNSISTPLYDQLKQILKEAIDQGVYKSGERLPNETELCELYGVSRITVRRAIQDLADEGFLERKQGKGTFVTRTKIARELVSIDGFSDFSKQIGKNPSKRILACEEMKATPEIAEALQIAIDSPVLKLVRIMSIDQQPFTLDIAHYSLERFPDLTARFTEHASTYEVLKNIYHININSGKSKKIITVTPASKFEAEHLDCEIGETLFNIDKTVYDETGVPIHISNFKTQTQLIALTITT